MAFPWFEKPFGKAIKEARELGRRNRGVLATRLTELEQQRNVLDEMVKRSLELMETKK